MTEAEAFPDLLALTSEGFLDAFGERLGGGSRVWRGERPRPDRIHFRMTRSI